MDKVISGASASKSSSTNNITACPLFVEQPALCELASAQPFFEDRIVLFPLFLIFPTIRVARTAMHNLRNPAKCSIGNSTWHNTAEVPVQI